MTLNFPSNPTDGQIYSYNNLNWQWNQSTSTWIALTAGVVGPTGPQGIAGSTGPQGIAGPTGPQGQPASHILFIPGMPSSASLDANQTGIIYTASQSTIVAIDLTVRACGNGTGGAEDVTEISHISVSKHPTDVSGTPIATVYGQITNSPPIAFTRYDVGLDNSNNIIIIADTNSHGSSRQFNYQVTEYGN